MIDYSIINESIEYYTQKGFQRIESPWTVTAPIADITKPKGNPSFTIKEKNKVLVASGEQSFLYLYNKGFLPKGKFQTCGPCFRDDSFDEWHTKYFIKNELIITDDVSKKQLAFIVNTARDFFRQYCSKEKLGLYEHPVENGYIDDVLIVDITGNIVNSIEERNANLWATYDLVFRGIELGSYGIRECSFLKWIYGTGVAEPRLSRIIQKYAK